MSIAEFQKFQLIQLVRDHPCLWRVGDPEYREKDKRKRAWIEVSEALELDDLECQKIWRNLRTQFGRELAQNRTRWGFGGKIKSWRYLSSLQFLKDVMFPKRARPYLDTQDASQPESDSQPPQEEADSLRSGTDCYAGAAASQDPVMNDQCKPKVTLLPIYCEPPVEPKCSPSVHHVKRPIVEVEDEEEEPRCEVFIKKTKPNRPPVIPTSSEEEDAESKFGQYICHTLRKLPHKERELAKLQIQQVIYNIQVGNVQPPSSSLSQQQYYLVSNN